MAAKKKEDRASASASKGKPKIGEKKGDRDAKGRFVPGWKSNGGRKALPDDLKQAFREACPDALKTLVRIVNNEGAKDSDRIRAAEVILDRGYGKPVQAVDLDASSIPQVVILGDVPD